ncbi:uncharacterized protein LOC142162154 [Nicotiana tabacum]|uniref:Uncharacterized protein LOC142162154 n=1 Tax=Nicotiana tabacum TaxID=4097 RepID=A0AC58RPC2_TOBAC
MIINKIVPGWNWYDNTCLNSKGRIWLVWNPRVLMLQSSLQCIHCCVRDPAKNMKFKFTAVYGLHTVDDRKGLWDDLKSLETGIQDPWLVMGNFNAVLKLEDRKNGSQIQDGEVRDFENFLNSTSLAEMKYVGRNYTWTNNHVYSKIDRALVNHVWLSLWPHLEVVVRDPYFSNHALLCITLTEQQNKCVEPFKFLNYLADHHEFLQIVERTWNTPVQGIPMERLWLKLKMMKQQMKMLNATNFSKVDVRVQIARQQLTELQEQMRDSLPAHELYIKEKELKENLEKWILVEESILRQKSRVQWLKLGDTNFAYFHANIKNIITQNKIRSLVSDRGEMIQSEKGIEDEILGFYK